MKNKLYPLILIVIISLLYFFTVCPTIYVGDTPELSADMYCAGIGHPPGYPLYLVTGFIFARTLYTIFGGEFAFYSNLFSSFWTVLSVYVFYKLLIFFAFKIIKIPNNKIIYFLIFVISLLFATGESLWNQSVVTEVYTLHFFFHTVLILLIFKIYYKYLPFSQQKKVKYKSKLKFYQNVRREVALTGIITGLGFTHHLTFILVIPSLVILLWQIKKYILIRNTVRTFTIFFLIGCLPVLYMPVRAMTNPSMNWGNTETPKLFYEHFTGKLYHKKFMSASLEQILKNIIEYIILITKQSGIWFVVLIAFGLIQFYKSYKKLFYVLIVHFLFIVLYSINYNIPDIDGYYLPTYILLYICAFFGLYKLFVKYKNKIFVVIITILSICACIRIIFNYNDNDLSQSRQLKQYIENILYTVPDDCIFVIGGDDVIGGLSYIQVVEKRKPNVITLASNFDPYPWYFDLLRQRGKDLIKVPEYNNDNLETMSKRVIDANIDEKNIIALYSQDNVVKYYKFVPDGLTGKLYKKNNKNVEKADEEKIDKSLKYYEMKNFENYIHGKPVNDHASFRLQSILTSYSVGLLNIAIYYLQHGRLDKIPPVLKEVENVNPEYPRLYFVYGTYYFYKHNYKKALELFEKVKKISPEFDNIDNYIFTCKRKKETDK